MTMRETLVSFPLVKEKKALLPYAFVKQKKILPIAEQDDRLLVAVVDFSDLDALDELRLLCGRRVQAQQFPLKEIEEAIEICYQHKEGRTEALFSQTGPGEGGAENGIEGYDLLAQNDLNPVVERVNGVLMEAIQQRASDIHFEPGEEAAWIRYRIDGLLQMRHTLSKDLYAQLLARIKVMAKMDVAEHRLPQDGRIKLFHGGREIDFRMSTLPTVHGERGVLRILDKGNVLLGLHRMGMHAQLLSDLQTLIRSPEGMLLVTGPTGSGKTTTLYGALTELNAKESNILTIEDPVEYKLPGISQMNVNAKIELDFAKGLRHILRQDPDVILIGEIRDQETAEIAIQASLTGHFVLSTLHTNDAPSALTRLADMGIAPYLLASSLLGVVAQRLVRRLCTQCRESYVESDGELKGCSLYRAAGCSHCFGTGYRGRVGIYELMWMTRLLKEQVLVSQDAEQLRQVAMREGMQGLFSYGMERVKEGVTTTAELLRVRNGPST